MKKIIIFAGLMLTSVSAIAQNNENNNVSKEINSTNINVDATSTDNLGLGKAAEAYYNAQDKIFDRLNIGTGQGLWAKRATILMKKKLDKKGRLSSKEWKKLAKINAKLGLDMDDITTKRSEVLYEKNRRLNPDTPSIENQDAQRLIRKN